MSDMKSALSVWQLVIIIAIPLTLLCGWIITVFVVAREPRADAAAPVSSAAPGLLAGTGVAGNGSAWVAPADEGAGAAVGGQDQPLEPPRRRLAA